MRSQHLSHWVNQQYATLRYSRLLLLIICTNTKLMVPLQLSVLVSTQPNSSFFLCYAADCITPSRTAARSYSKVEWLTVVRLRSKYVVAPATASAAAEEVRGGNGGSDQNQAATSGHPSRRVDAMSTKRHYCYHSSASGGSTRALRVFELTVSSSIPS